MHRTAILSLFVALIGVGPLHAAEMEGKLKEVDAKKSTITVIVDGKDRTFKVVESTELLDAKGKPIKERLKSPVLKTGALVKFEFLCDNGLKMLQIISNK